MAGAVRLADPTLDAAACARIYAPYVRDTPISFEIDPPDEAEMRTRIANTLHSFPWLVFEQDDEVLGYAYASVHNTRRAYRWSAEVSVYVDLEHRGAGIGKQLYAELFALMRAQRYRTLLAGMTTPNAASSGIHESFGFEPVATYKNIGFKGGKWHDVTWFELELIPPGEGEPEEPLPPAT